MSFFDKLKSFGSQFMTLGKNALGSIKTGLGTVHNYSTQASNFLKSDTAKKALEC